MEQKTPISPLIYMAFGMAFIIAIGLITLRKPEFSYILSPGDAHTLALDNKHNINPSEVLGLSEGELLQYQFIDLRNTYDIVRGAIPASLSIPRHSLLLSGSWEVLQELNEEGRTIVLYDGDGSTVNGPWFVLSQLGLDKLKILTGGYAAYQAASLAPKDSLPALQQPEQARYAFQSIVDSIVSAAGQPLPAAKEKKPEKVVTVKRARSSAIEGGC